jgi:hypothetical protein
MTKKTEQDCEGLGQSTTDLLRRKGSRHSHRSDNQVVGARVQSLLCIRVKKGKKSLKA